MKEYFEPSADNKLEENNAELSSEDGALSREEEIVFREIVDNKCFFHVSSISSEGQKKIIFKLFEIGKKKLLLFNLNKFEIDNELCFKLIEIGETFILHSNLHHIKALDKEVGLKLIEANDDHFVLTHQKKFPELDSKEIALKMIENGRYAQLFHSLHYLPDLVLNKDWAKLFCKHDCRERVDKEPDVFNIPAEDLEKAANLNLSISEFLLVENTLPADLDKKNKNDQASSIFNQLKINDPLWQDEQNIGKPFSEGSQLFGGEKMFEYLSRPELSRHDGLHNFKRIIELANKSSLTPSNFYNNILEQVRHDDVKYEDGTAHHHLNNLASNISLDFEATKNLASQYQDIEKLTELAKLFDRPEAIFASWKNLKKYEELSRLLERADILKRLQELKNTGNLPLYRYIETLAFHPNIEMDKVFKFWENPQEFLELEDSHTPEKVHDRKKPSNYIEFPNLDLEASELRDALVDGKYDALQAFRPLSIEYSLLKEKTDYSLFNLIAELNKALGKRSEGIKGEAKNPPKLFKAIQKILESENISLSEVLSSEKKVSESTALKIREVLSNPDIGLPVAKSDQEKYRAKINLKSDPDGVVAGNDTACCMPFGSGKNNVYTFNPDCSLFTLQKKNSNGIWRTIAQSVLTKDMTIDKKVSEIVRAMQSTGGHLNEIVSDEILQNQKSVIACDNIEVSPNFKKDGKTIAMIYRDFFTEYLKQFGGEDNFDKSKVIIGTGYSDALTDLPLVENKYIPRAPVGYSDKLGESVYLLSLDESEKFLSRKVSNYKSEEKEDVLTSVLPKGIQPLTFEDSLPVAYIEGKAYCDNQSLIEYLHNMENALIAKDINNAAKNRPNMSFKYVDDNKAMHGYLLAYEGKINKEGEAVVYISDLASDGNTRAGGALIIGFTEEYKRNYLDKENFIPIYAQMREKTSYAIIKKQLDKLAKGTGIAFKMEETDSYAVEDDVMHQVLIRPVRN